MTSPFLSVVIPAYNEERRITGTLERVIEYLTGKYAFEVVIVDDGSSDGTASLVRVHASHHPQIRLISYSPNRGKGAAVQAGMLHAAGQMICFTDADLSTPISAIGQMLVLLEGGYDVVIASRALPASQFTLRQHIVREAMGKLFNVLVRAMFALPCGDTQCGFKGFRREAARAIFSRTQIAGFAFDVEVLILARRLGYTLAEIPVRWENSQLSKVRIPGHLLQMLSELWQIRRQVRRNLCRRFDASPIVRGDAQQSAEDAVAHQMVREACQSP